MNDGDAAPRFWSCAKDEPTGRLSRALGVPETFGVEISAHERDDEGRIVAELVRAFPFLGDAQALDDVIDPLANHKNPLPQDLFVIRDIPDDGAARDNAARVADLIGSDYPVLFARQFVVLDGWKEASQEVRWGDASRVWPVRPLKTS